MSAKTFTVGQVEQCLNLRLRPELAESWDNVGLLIGDRSGPVRRMMICLDLTVPVVRAARARRADFVLAYHPPIFDPLKSVLADRHPVIYQAIRAGLAVYAIHTAYDMIADGTSDALADLLDLKDRLPIRPTTRSDRSKLVVFIPEDHVDRVASAMFEAGAGVIGGYTRCSFRTTGRGTFLGDKTTHPSVGQAGTFETVAEVRLEVLVDNGKLSDVVRGITRAHPYEEPAFDIYPLAGLDPHIGLGRIGRLARPGNLRTLVARLKRKTALKAITPVTADPDRAITTAAVCPGSCGDLARKVAGTVDLYLTGELRHHDALALRERGTNVICLGHGNSERPGLTRLCKTLQAQLGQLTIFLSDRHADPLVIS